MNNKKRNACCMSRKEDEDIFERVSSMRKKEFNKITDAAEDKVASVLRIGVRRWHRDGIPFGWIVTELLSLTPCEMKKLTGIVRGYQRDIIKLNSTIDDKLGIR